MVRPTINSQKHIVQETLTSIAVGTVGNFLIANAVNNPDSSISTDVEVGTVIKAVYIELWLLSNAASITTATSAFMKLTAGTGLATNADMADLHNYSSKMNIFECHQGIVGEKDVNPVPFYRHWIKIPKGKQRIGINEKLSLAIRSITGTTDFCGLAIYKAYN